MIVRLMGIIAVAVLFGLVALRVALIACGAVLILRSARQCPACLEETALLHTPRLRRLLPAVEWRWCPHCGWHGPGRAPADRTARFARHKILP